ncbi:MAG: hypothetical protein IID43_05080, partial [Planctomycetes bacterium]|nr:hypothetical protein [Planctomycetota bacterium]
MTTYIIRRLLYAIPTLLGVMLLSFVLFNVVGGDISHEIAGKTATPETVAEIRAEYGWDKPLLRCLLANLRTTGPRGFRSGRLTEARLQEKGWRHYWEDDRTNIAPHYESWLWACFLWAYDRTGLQPFLDRPLAAIRTTMEA